VLVKLNVKRKHHGVWMLTKCPKKYVQLVKQLFVLLMNGIQMVVSVKLIILPVLLLKELLLLVQIHINVTQEQKLTLLKLEQLLMLTQK